MNCQCDFESLTYKLFNAGSRKASAPRVVFLVFASLVFHTGCASPYKGLGPNFRVKDPKEIKAEYESFQVKTTFLGFGGYKMGNKVYTHETVQPLIKEIAPKAADQIQKGRAYMVMGMVFSTLGAFYLVSPDTAKLTRDASAALLLTGLASATYGSITVQSGAQMYNEKLSATLNLVMRF